MHYKARQVLRDLFSTNQVNGSEMTFVARVVIQRQIFEILAIIGRLDTRNNLKKSVIQ